MCAHRSCVHVRCRRRVPLVTATNNVFSHLFSVERTEDLLSTFVGLLWSMTWVYSSGSSLDARSDEIWKTWRFRGIRSLADEMSTAGGSAAASIRDGGIRTSCCPMGFLVSDRWKVRSSGSLSEGEMVDVACVSLCSRVSRSSPSLKAGTTL